MKSDVFYNLVLDAQEAKSCELFIAERGWQEWMEEYGENTSKLVSDMESIWQAINMPMAEMRAVTGLSQVAFAKYLCTSRRTVENWESGTNPPVHLRLLLAEKFGILNVNREL